MDERQSLIEFEHKFRLGAPLTLSDDELLGMAIVEKIVNCKWALGGHVCEGI